MVEAAIFTMIEWLAKKKAGSKLFPANLFRSPAQNGDNFNPHRHPLTQTQILQNRKNNGDNFHSESMLYIKST
jgi:hypothetical protein